MRVSAPGRICLFGEHQDYLGLPVIAAAISLRLSIEGRGRNDQVVRIALPDIGKDEKFQLSDHLTYAGKRDYFRSGINVARRHGVVLQRGFECRVTSRIPIQAGTSSSSALAVAWVRLLMLWSDRMRDIPPNTTARYAHEAEVLEFHEAGGMMDQYTSAFGGIVAIDFAPQPRVEQLPARLGGFVLGDSGEPKNTQGVLRRVRERVEGIMSALLAKGPPVDLYSAQSERLHELSGVISGDDIAFLTGTLRNRDLTLRARELLREPDPDHRRIGRLLTEHHTVLRDVQQISTPKIDRMLDSALNAGAFGGKINGSGGGGCMFAYAPENPEQAAEAIERAGGRAYVLSVDEGVRVEVFAETNE